MSAQTPGHFGSIPAERAVNDLDQENARLERAIVALRQQQEEEHYWAEQQAKRQRNEALRREYEALQQSVSRSTPRTGLGLYPEGSSARCANLAKAAGPEAGVPVGQDVLQQASPLSAPVPQVPPGICAGAPGSMPVSSMGDPGRQAHAPPGLGFLGREPPRGASEGRRPPP